MAPTVWRLLILAGTLFCVVMLYAPLVTELVVRIKEAAASLP